MKKNLLTIFLLFILSIPSAVFGNSIESFEHDYAVIQKDGYYGVIDLDGVITVKPIWAKLNRISAKYAEIQKDNKSGLIDITTGDLVIEPNWTDVIGFINQDWLVITNSPYYYVYDVHTGKQVPKTKFNSENYVIPAYGIPYLELKNGNKLYTFNNGRTITLNKEYVLESFYTDTGIVSKGDFYGLVDEKGHLISDKQWDSIKDFYESDVTVAIKDNIESVINKQGKTLFESKWDSIGQFYGDISIVSKESKYGLINKTGKIILPIEWDEIRVNHMDYNAPYVARKNNQYVYVNTATGQIIKDKLSYAADFSEGIAFARRANAYIHINEKGEEVFELNATTRQFGNGLATFIKDGKVGFVNISGEIISEAQWDGTHGFSEGLAAVKTAEEWAYMSLEDWKKDHPNSILGALTSDGRVQVIKNSGKWGFINDSGEAITKCAYDDVKSFKNGRAIVLKDNVWCVIDSLGNTIFELN